MFQAPLMRCAVHFVCFDQTTLSAECRVAVRDLRVGRALPPVVRPMLTLVLVLLLCQTAVGDLESSSGILQPIHVLSTQYAVAETNYESRERTA